MELLTKEQKQDDLVKSLIESGFDEETIVSWLESGSITLEKAVPEEDGEDPEVNDDDIDDDDIGDDDDGDDEEDEVEKKIKKGKFLKKAVEDDDEEDDKFSKSLASDIFKSIEVSMGDRFEDMQDDILKSINGSIGEAIEEAFEPILKSLEGMRKAISAFGASAPSFKTSGLNKAIIEKSIEMGGGAKDQDGKTALSATRDRSLVRDLISKTIQEEPDPEIQKSLTDSTNAYLLDPIEGAVGEYAARYMYDKKNVRLVQ